MSHILYPTSRDMTKRTVTGGTFTDQVIASSPNTIIFIGDNNDITQSQAEVLPFSSSWALYALYAVNGGTGSAGTVLVTGSTYPITSSNSIRSLSASYAPISSTFSSSLVTQIAAKQNTILTASTYNITASRALSASYAPYTDTNTWLVTGSTYPITSSNAVRSISSSYSPVDTTFSSSLVSQLSGKQATLITGGTYNITASYAINVLNGSTGSSSSGSSGTTLTTGSTYPITASRAISASYAPYTDTNTWLVTGSTYPITSSNAVRSISSSYSPIDSTFSSSLVSQLSGKQATLVSTTTYSITSSRAISASYAPYTDTNTWLTTGSTYPITASVANYLTNGSAGYLIKFTGSNNNEPAASDLYISPNANGNQIGINTTAPTSFLHFVGKESKAAIRLQRYYASANQAISFAPTDEEITAGSSSYIIGQSNDDFRITPYPPGINNSVIYLKSGSSDGFRVGIKTENPQSTLHVVGNMTVSSGITGSLLGNASTSTTASYALNGGGSGTTITSGSTYNITSSISIVSLTSITSDFSILSTYADSSSYLSNHPEVIGVSLSNLTSALTTGSTKESIRMPFAGTLTSVSSFLNTTASGQTVIVDINKNGNSILSTKLSIDANEELSISASSQAVIASSSFNMHDKFTFDIDQVGTTHAGTGLKVYLYMTRT